jgi:hypothetical protein
MNSGSTKSIPLYFTHEEVVQRVLSHPTDDVRSGARLSDPSWAGCTWEESVDYLTNGWQEGVANLDATPHYRMSEAMRPTVVWDVAGSECDVASYLSGVPECMGETVRRKRPSPVVRIGIDMCTPGGVSAERVFRVGRQVITLVESLRLAGVPAEIWACKGLQSSIYPGITPLDIRVRIQEPSRPIDTSRIAYWGGHPAANRRTLWAVQEQYPELRGKFGFFHGSGYGRPVANFAKAEFDEWTPPRTVSDEDLQAWAEDVLNRRAR